ncbi:Formamidopyrimidine-DNA glycosylase N-terminal domain-containing protein [Durotheca rogersii]|uniref:Formamidopyrimidine-DNA glycosylase N-terminal domain-containing protein n=1 Tax=Durotheca rogersii TaxID=419775 RepID=UPI00221EADCF|nr:Formamidopyrimidine-DNA glycosylase N-terminal domain-containing protein [Durotheca rogersii]XP_051374897.1 Formamidopyrimidine-DNA glycosylase N-terminal domain-containing protein [Durotheca rogersii]KAI5849671.1 Formamidopyrimidine-DNA glycosylase N-terminal domain-containing protein [Durotheca rogersii]KAI5866187.1 Formamidopyrimidine-DNA glycosylase N-terminal domain-containing protein [Durotheca rogersii]
MPEIAEVARITHFLRRHLVGKTISRVFALDDANVFGKAGTTGLAFQEALAGKEVTDVGSQGKYFWMVLSSPPHAVMHLGMTGWVQIRGIQTGYTRYVERTKGDKELWPPKFWKFHLETDGDPKVEVAFTDARRFGRIRLVDCPGKDIRKHSPLVENGPDPVIDRHIFTERFLRDKMRSRRVPVKALLLDQTTVSGIGNWVGDEILYQAKLHPEQYCNEFDDADVHTLYDAICYVCDTAVAKLGDSDQFPDHWLFNHRWSKGKKDSPGALPNGDKITFLTVGGRTSCVVPSVQKKRCRVKEEEPAPGSDDETESRFFPGRGEAETEERGKRPAKKARTPRSKPVKPEDEAEPAPPSRSRRGANKKEEQEDKGAQIELAPEIGARRRSGRLKRPAPE